MNDLRFTPLTIHLDGDNAYADLADETVLDGSLEAVAVLPEATNRGKPAVTFKVKLADGSYVLATTTWNLLYTAARAIEARYGPATD